MSFKKLSRREFLKFMGVGAGVLTLNGCAGISDNFLSRQSPGRINSVDPTLTIPPSISVDLIAARTDLQLLPGQKTPGWKYLSVIHEGDAGIIEEMDDSFLGPIIRVKKGQRVKVELKNKLPDPTIIHWHGLKIPEKMDGHPRQAVAPGESYSYDFQVINRPGMYWFHPHPDKLTGYQVYYGLAGLFIVEDESESEFGLPKDDFDIPFVIQDRTFDSENRMVYLENGMMDQMVGFLGDTILVNGIPNLSMELKAGHYRFRLLNGSNSRIYKLGWNDGAPLSVIGSDGGLLENPISKNFVTLAPGERVEIFADFSTKTDNEEVKLVSLPFSGFDNGMGSMMGNRSYFPNGTPFDLVNLRFMGKSNILKPLPAKFSAMERYSEEDAVNRAKPRTFFLEMQRMIHTINGRLFEMDSVSNDEIVKKGDLEIWEFVNLEGTGRGMGMMNMEMPHPMHIHGVQFQVLSRQVSNINQDRYRELSEGFINDGWKDTVLVMPGEKVRVLVRFEDYAGNYIYHCHNLEHEDAGMMRNYRIEERL